MPTFSYNELQSIAHKKSNCKSFSAINSNRTFLTSIKLCCHATPHRNVQRRWQHCAPPSRRICELNRRTKETTSQKFRRTFHCTMFEIFTDKNSTRIQRRRNDKKTKFTTSGSHHSTVRVKGNRRVSRGAMLKRKNSFHDPAQTECCFPIHTGSSRAINYISRCGRAAALTFNRQSNGRRHFVFPPQPHRHAARVRNRWLLTGTQLINKRS